MTVRSDDELDFDALAQLARDDPEAFEALRQRQIAQLIDNAPEPSRRRRQGLQWRIDMERAQSDSALSACVRISGMMWDSVVGEGGLLTHLGRLRRGEAGTPSRASADVLPFKSDKVTKR